MISIVSNSYYGIPRGLGLEHPIMSFETIEIKMAAVSAKRSIQVTLSNFLFVCRKQVSRSKLEAEKENIKVPTTVDEYCVKSRPSRSETEDLTDFYDDDYADDLDDDDDDEDCAGYSEDSGNEET